MAERAPAHAFVGHELVEPFAESCFGTLWRARDRDEGREVLLRQLAVSKLSDAEREEVSRAARMIAGMEDEMLVPVLDVIASGEELGIVNAPVEGLPLRSLLRTVRDDDAPLDPPVAMRIACDMLEAAGALHRRLPKVLGRPTFSGLSPDVFLVCDDGRTRMLEPGVASVLRRAKLLAQDPERLGYDAPEVFQVGIEVEASADVFSIGAMLWEMLRAERLLTGTLFHIVGKLRKGPLPRADAGRHGERVAAELADVVQRALEQPAPDRLATPAAMLEALGAATHEIAGAGAVAALVARLAPAERERLSAEHARREELTAQARAASERPPASRPAPTSTPAPTSSAPPPAASPHVDRSPAAAMARLRAGQRQHVEIEGESGRLEARSYTPLWIALAVGAVGAIGYAATRQRLAEPAHYVLQVVRPPAIEVPSAEPSAAPSATASARAFPPMPQRVRSPAPSATAPGQGGGLPEVAPAPSAPE